MKFFKQYGSKERLFEMMNNVNKIALNEADDDSGLSYDPTHPANRPQVEYLSIEQIFDRMVEKFKGKPEMPSKWDVMPFGDYESMWDEAILAWKIGNNQPITDQDYSGVGDFAAKYAREKYGNTNENTPPPIAGLSIGGVQ